MKINLEKFLQMIKCFFGSHKGEFCKKDRYFKCGFCSYKQSFSSIQADFHAGAINIG